MSRVGKLPIVLPEKVEVQIQNNTILVKWPLGELTFTYSHDVELTNGEEGLVVELKNQENKAIWGTTRSIIASMVTGVKEGFKKTLEIQGVWYKFELQGEKLIMSLGFSHKVEMLPPKGIKITLDEKEKNTLHISGIDKQKVGEFSAQLRALKKPEPYKGKWIRYSNEQVRRKAGKSGKK